MLENLKNRFIRAKSEMLSFPGDEQSLEWQGHKIIYSVTGEGAPLVMLHGLNAAAWAIEFRKNVPELSRHYKIYVPDLPGFGRSERKKLDYTAEMSIDFAGAFVKKVCEIEGRTPAVIANSLTAAHVIEAVSRNPESFGPLILLCPTGLEALDFPPGKGAIRTHRILKGFVGDIVFRLLTTRLSTRIFLGRDGYFDKNKLDDELIEGYIRSARQKNGKYAPISFVSFLLNHSIQKVWSGIKQPVMTVWGRESKITPFRHSQTFIQQRPETELKVIERARLAANDECPEEFNALVLEFLSRHYSAASVALA
jgi:pimeloyl-ACP methyl ester carboxylesterase